MIISRTPYRISFFGGGTDYPAWYRRHGGRVISTSIDKYCHISARFLPPFFNIRHRIVWSHIETVQSIREILHPAVREGLRFLGFTDATGVEIHHQGDLPARTGMGSSSSFAVGLIHALLAMRGETPDPARLAALAIELEQERLRESVGSQDQAAAAHGGFNVIDFSRDGAIRVTPLAITAKRSQALQERLMLFYTGLSRLASDIATDVIANIPAREEQLHQMRDLVDEAERVLLGGDLDDFGRLLDRTWRLKRQLSALVSNEMVDSVYDRAQQAGALGGKLLGAGTSGFMLFYVPPERRDEVREALRDLLHVPFQFEEHGSTLLPNTGTGARARIPA
ncbi:kinase [Azospirillum sp. RWY-5-1]|uniref:Kinase n=1 Tax=Azospirillum oleiclasticum TaxID=2735135 RepID=A0ABX2TL79_9PROT|nr:kinase [Azospirillum oleiclasticum]NYZ17501.1 kinase [Azospirillum oleiclasticum]NYZ24879.1 kinase [Azospirillum oleiclasticum]